MGDQFISCGTADNVDTTPTTLIIEDLTTYNETIMVLIEEGLFVEVNRTLPDIPRPAAPVYPPTDPALIDTYDFLYIDWNLVVNGAISQPTFTATVPQTVFESFVIFDGSSSLSITPIEGSCLYDFGPCIQTGFSIIFIMQLYRPLVENTVVLSNGGEQPDKCGIAAIHRFGKMQYVLSTATDIWYAESLSPNNGTGYNVAISFNRDRGLEAFVDGIFLGGTYNHVERKTRITCVPSDWHIGCSASDENCGYFYMSPITFT